MATGFDASAPPPPELIRGLVEGPTLLTGFEWHEEIDSTNRRAAELAAEGAAEGYAIAADVQTAGRGRRGRSWTAPPGTSLMVSFLLRPAVPSDALTLLPLLAGAALAEVAERHVPGAPVALKWPNDLLVGDRKAAGILVEQHAGAAVVGIGLNVDWRGVERPSELAGATSLAEAADAGAGAVPERAARKQSPALARTAGAQGRALRVDRWRVFAGLVGVLGNRYADWRADPRGFLPDYRARCATLGLRVRVDRPDGVVEGTAEAIVDSGALLVRDDRGVPVEIAAGDVTHVRAA